MRLEFEDVAASALARAESLLAAWIGGRRHGHEWKGERRVNGGPGDSWCVNLNTGAWLHGAGGEAGGDLISLYAALNATDQVKALQAVAELVGSNPPARVEKKTTEKASEYPPSPIPPDAPPVPGNPAAVYRYGTAFVVARYETSDGKDFRPYTWRNGRWHAKAYPAPRPIYNAALIGAEPDAPVLIVEGEKCADAAAGVLRGHIVVTWAGGAQAVDKSDWRPLAGRNVTIWPDADAPGKKAAINLAEILVPLKASVRIMDIGDQSEGWDVADAVAEHRDIEKFIAERGRPVAPPKAERHTRTNPLPPTAAATISAAGDVLDTGSAFVAWQSLGLECNQGGQPYPTLGNAALLISRHPDLSGKIWLDSFRRQIWHTLRGKPTKWVDADALRLTAWINQQMRMPKMGLLTVHNAVELVAVNNTRNSVTDWLDSLVWDGTERLPYWLGDCLGVALTPFTQAVARNWLISMVARAYRPGCQADHMPVLEGRSGAGKSSALAILGGEWYKAAPQAFGTKAFLEVILGAWLVEIPDMVGFGKREHSEIISAITTRTDCYRAAYGRHAEDHPRATIFAATSETDEYLQDSRGERRYWPLHCTEIRLDALREQREQLFAEAVGCFNRGDGWHSVPDNEAQIEQSAREESDIWMDKIAEYAAARTSVSAAEVATNCLAIEPGKQNRADQMRISKCLKKLGFVCKTERVGKRVSRIYRLPS